MEELKYNSLKPKSSEPRKVESVVSKPVTTSKKTSTQKAEETFLSIAGEIGRDIVMPVLKSTIMDVLNNALSMLLYGTPSGRRRDPDRYSTRSRTSYDKYYDDRDRGRREPERSRHRYNYMDLDNIEMYSLAEAREAKERILDIVYDDGRISVAQIHEVFGLPTTYTEYDWGYRELDDRDIRIRQVRVNGEERWAMSFPAAERLK